MITHLFCNTPFLSSISNRLSNFFGKGWSNDFLVEHTGLEPVASTLPVWRAPNCANAPWHDYNTVGRRREVKNNFIADFFVTVNPEG